jgi:hypothetical protein
MTDTVKAYFEDMLWTTFGGRFFGGIVAEWQQDAVKEYASKFKEAEIDHSSFPYQEKEELKWQWKQWLETTSQGVKAELRREGR